MHGGTCIEEFNSATNHYTPSCLCTPGWMGEICSHKCASKPTDLMFLLDSSSSEGDANFHKQVAFVSNVADSLEVAPDKIQIGLATFSTMVSTVIPLNMYNNNADLRAAIGKTPYIPGMTNTGQALQYARTDMMSPTQGRRLEARAVLVLLTDGRSLRPADTAAQAQALKNTGALVIAVGIGRDVDASELNAIASGPDNVYNTTFGLLNTIQQAIVTKTTICH